MTEKTNTPKLKITKFVIVSYETDEKQKWLKNNRYTDAHPPTNLFILYILTDLSPSMQGTVTDNCTSVIKSQVYCITMERREGEK